MLQTDDGGDNRIAGSRHPVKRKGTPFMVDLRHEGACRLMEE
jgi:hypothetical protein